MSDRNQQWIPERHLPCSFESDLPWKSLDFCELSSSRDIFIGLGSSFFSDNSLFIQAIEFSRHCEYSRRGRDKGDKIEKVSIELRVARLFGSVCGML